MLNPKHTKNTSPDNSQTQTSHLEQETAHHGHSLFGLRGGAGFETELIEQGKQHREADAFENRGTRDQSH